MSRSPLNKNKNSGGIDSNVNGMQHPLAAKSVQLDQIWTDFKIGIEQIYDARTSMSRTRYMELYTYLLHFLIV